MHCGGVISKVCMSDYNNDSGNASSCIGTILSQIDQMD